MHTVYTVFTSYKKEECHFFDWKVHWTKGTSHTHPEGFWKYKFITTIVFLFPHFKPLLLSSKRSLKNIFKISFPLVVCLTTGPKPLPKRAFHIVRSLYWLSYPGPRYEVMSQKKQVLTVIAVRNSDLSHVSRCIILETWHSLYWKFSKFYTRFTTAH